ncbi:CBS domain-containing protein, partial [bacterium]
MTAHQRVADVMQILDSLKVVPVWVDPNHMVESARVLMDGHDLSALCVLDREGQPIGTLRRDVATAIPGNARVGEVMESVLGVLDANDTLRQAADLLVRIDRHYAPMMR